MPRISEIKSRLAATPVDLCRCGHKKKDHGLAGKCYVALSPLTHCSCEQFEWAGADVQYLLDIIDDKPVRRRRSSL